MSELRCPFCGKFLDAVVKNQNDWIYSCGNPSCEFFDDCDNYEKKHYLATPEFWQELIRTHKALDVALDWLGQVATPEKCDDDLCREFTKRKLTEIKTVLEQKE